MLFLIVLSLALLNGISCEGRSCSSPGIFLDFLQKIVDRGMDLEEMLDCTCESGHLCLSVLNDCGIQFPERGILSPVLDLLKPIMDIITTPYILNKYCCAVRKDSRRKPELRDSSKRRDIFKRCLNNLPPGLEISDDEVNDFRRTMAVICSDETKATSAINHLNYLGFLDEASIQQCIRKLRLRCTDLKDCICSNDADKIMKELYTCGVERAIAADPGFAERVARQVAYLLFTLVVEPSDEEQNNIIEQFEPFQCCSEKDCMDVRQGTTSWEDYCDTLHRDCKTFVASDPDCTDCVEGFEEQMDVCLATVKCVDIKDGTTVWNDFCAASNKKCVDSTTDGPSCKGCLPNFVEDSGNCRPPKVCTDILSGSTTYQADCESKFRNCQNSPTKDASCGSCFDMYFEVGTPACVLFCTSSYDGTKTWDQFCAETNQGCTFGSPPKCEGCKASFVSSGTTCRPIIKCFDNKAGSAETWSAFCKANGNQGCSDFGFDAKCDGCVDGFIKQGPGCVVGIRCRDKKEGTTTWTDYCKNVEFKKCGDFNSNAACTSCISGYTADGTRCRPTIKCTDTKEGTSGTWKDFCNSMNQNCDSIFSDARCFGCFPGFTPQSGTCIENKKCSDLKAGSTLTWKEECDLLNKNCAGQTVNDIGCTTCKDGFISEGTDCRPPKKCSDVKEGSTTFTQSCETLKRKCKESPTADPTCGDCMDGLSEVDGECKHTCIGDKELGPKILDCFETEVLFNEEISQKCFQQLQLTYLTALGAICEDNRKFGAFYKCVVNEAVVFKPQYRIESERKLAIDRCAALV